MISYTAPRATIQELLQKHAPPENKNLHVQKVLQKIKTCRTSSLGYHVYQCSDERCGHVKYQYHPSFIGTAEIVIVLIVVL